MCTAVYEPVRERLGILPEKSEEEKIFKLTDGAKEVLIFASADTAQFKKAFSSSLRLREVRLHSILL